MGRSAKTVQRDLVAVEVDIVPAEATKTKRHDSHYRMVPGVAVPVLFLIIAASLGYPNAVGPLPP